MRPAEQTIHEDFLVIPNVSGDRVLLVQGRRWSLPRLTNALPPIVLRKEQEWHNVARVERAMRSRLGLAGPIVRCLHAGHDRWSQFTYEVAPPPATWTPPDGAQWVGRDEIRRLHLDVPEHQALLERWFAEASDPAAVARRPPWYLPGWEDEALPWIEEQLSNLGLTARTPPEKLRHRERSCEYRIRTSGGQVRFKAVPPAFAHEAPVTEALSQLFPGQVPNVLAHDEGRGWMLLDALDPAKSLHLVRREASWADALRSYAQLQIDSRPHLAALRERGCPVRPMNDLPARLDALLQDTTTLNDPQPAPNTEGQLESPLSRDEIAGLHALVPALTAACTELAQATAVPPLVLEHGNVWPAYIFPTQDGDLFSDWQDAQITYPFFGPPVFMAKASELFNDPTIEGRLWDAYLEAWTDVAPPDELLHLFDLGRRLAALHYATMYHADILPTMSAPWEKLWLLRYPLRVLLHLWDDRETASHTRGSRRRNAQTLAPTPLHG